MSAFIMSEETINKMIVFMQNAVKNENHKSIIHFLSYQSGKEFAFMFEQENYLINDRARIIGQYLVDNNYASVNYRYNDKSEPYKFTYKPSYQSISIVQFLKYVDCLEYQSCEIENFYQSRFYYDLNAMRNMAISLLDGYSQASWG